VIAAELLRDGDDPEAAAAQRSLPGVRGGPPDRFLVVSKRGYGFVMQPDLSETTRSGRRFARVGKDDEVIGVTRVAGKAVVVATGRGKMLRFDVDDVTELTGPGRGVILIRPDKDDVAVGALALAPKGRLDVVTGEGNTRRLAVMDVPAGKRAGKGQRVVKRGGISGLQAAE
jgi:DNA gyrase subunit A